MREWDSLSRRRDVVAGGQISETVIYTCVQRLAKHTDTVFSVRNY